MSNCTHSTAKLAGCVLCKRQHRIDLLAMMAATIFPGVIGRSGSASTTAVDFARKILDDIEKLEPDE